MCASKPGNGAVGAKFSSNRCRAILAAVSISGGPAMATIHPYAAPGVYDPPIYSQAVKVTGAQTILYIAGQVAYGPEGSPMHAGDFKAQARAALQALKAQVEAGGGTMADIVKVNTYLTDIRHRAAYGPIPEEI